MAFGATIKKLRTDARISAQKLADEIGINADRLRKWEERDLNPRYDDAQKIEAYFGMTLEKVMNLPELPKFKKSLKNVLMEEEAPYHTFIKIKSNYVQRFTSLH
jgi:transcriptional regulator with XRE-family HTH domain